MCVHDHLDVPKDMYSFISYRHHPFQSKGTQLDRLFGNFKVLRTSVDATLKESATLQVDNYRSIRILPYYIDGSLNGLANGFEKVSFLKNVLVPKAIQVLSEALTVPPSSLAVYD